MGTNDEKGLYEAMILHNSTSIGDSVAPGDPAIEELIPKKVRFRDNEEVTSIDMVIERSSAQPTSWRDMLVGQSSKGGSNDSDENEAIVILEGDIQRSVVNGMPSITFSDRIHQILIQGMDNIVILKLLGCTIGFSALQNKLYSMWRPSAPIHMMDIENGYFLFKFQNKHDCDMALSEGPWNIFGQHLTVQPWTMAFDPVQAYPSVMMAWIRFPVLPSYLYSRKIISEIGELVGKVVKLDLNTDSRTRVRFARLAVYVDLEKPLVSQILINGRKQKSNEAMVEVSGGSPQTESKIQNLNVEGSEKKDGNYGPWMIVEKKSRRKSRENPQKSTRSLERDKKGSRFSGLETEVNKGTKKVNTNETGSINVAGPIFKSNKAPVVDPKLAHINFNESNQNLRKLTNGLGLGTHSPTQDPVAVEIAAEHESDGKALGAEEEPFVHQIDSNLKESVRSAGVVDIGSLDSVKHTAVVFFENKKPLLSNSSMAPMRVLNSGKGLKIRGKNSKQNKSLHESNVRFKNSSQHRVSLKKSMKQLVESISAITKENVDSGCFTRNDQQMEGFNTPRQKFIRAFREYNLKFGSDIVCLVEPRDLGFSGPAFTWQRGSTYVRLDRALANDEWMATFPQSLVQHLPRIKSYHRPLLLSTCPNFGFSKGRPQLVQKEVEIRDELENVLDHKDLLWRQKARCNWLQLGDRNTKFFIVSKAVEFFERLYGETSYILRDTPCFSFPKLSLSEVSFLESDISNEEIKRALFDMAPLKAPGSDEYHALFFQDQWDNVGGDMCQWVKEIFAGRQIEQGLNNTLIVLIPKKENPEDFSQF
ncbi:hypothetical protein CXB51_015567 [Gossypium anomalum]|uniref:DUF4283 domain-containing protein n=1 Tax=Gossypium anomalum TaxID=47600 RepID=A0A8J5Z168_9ROSI|nr:hypothetical protein CXB51_015567 [Gossypium anomalum]